VFVIRTNIVACERVFSKQNMIKDIKRKPLPINTFDALMRASLIVPDISEVEWQQVMRFDTMQRKEDFLTRDLSKNI